MSNYIFRFCASGLACFGIQMATLMLSCTDTRLEAPASEIDADTEDGTEFFELPMGFVSFPQHVTRSISNYLCFLSTVLCRPGLP